MYWNIFHIRLLSIFLKYLLGVVQQLLIRFILQYRHVVVRHRLWWLVTHCWVLRLGCLLLQNFLHLLVNCECSWCMVRHSSSHYWLGFARGASIRSNISIALFLVTQKRQLACIVVTCGISSSGCHIIYFSASTRWFWWQNPLLWLLNDSFEAKTINFRSKGFFGCRWSRCSKQASHVVAWVVLHYWNETGVSPSESLKYLQSLSQILIFKLFLKQLFSQALGYLGLGL